MRVSTSGLGSHVLRARVLGRSGMRRAVGRFALCEPTQRQHQSVHRRFASATTSTLAPPGFVDDRRASLRTLVESTSHPPLYRPSDAVLAQSFQHFHNTYKVLENGETASKETHGTTLRGRVVGVRRHGNKLAFLTVQEGETTLQFKLYRDAYDPEHRDEFKQLHKNLHRGDIVSASGVPGRTKAGELSLVVDRLRLLAPCMVDLPQKSGLVDAEVRRRNRTVDLLLRPELRENIRVRSSVISFIRSFLVRGGFLEVETPVLASSAGGAAARPFVTHHASLGQDMSLRVAPELFLKQLVVAGFDRVFEIGKCFRNEGIDATHSPEFTSVEFYMAHGDYNDLMRITEEMLFALTRTLFDGATRVNVSGWGEIDFTPPYRRISVVDEIEQRAGCKLPDLSSPDALDRLLDVATDNGVVVSEPYTVSRVFDALIDHFIASNCVQPSILFDFPAVMSPLASPHRSKPGVVERFELIVAGRELINAYTELNNPDEQRARFLAQQADREHGDVEAMAPDEDFCRALDVGMPPTAGWGMGIDRLCMLLTNSSNIKDVIAFPPVRERSATPKEDGNNTSTEDS